MARQRIPAWLVLAAAAYLAYFALLIYTQTARPLAADLPQAPGMSRSEVDARDLTLPLTAPSIDLQRDGVLYALRFMQLITLVLGTVVAFRRPHDPAAMSGAWLLATAGVFSVVLPSGWATAWQALPLIVTLLLWFPYLSSVVAGPIFLLFAARFTRHARATSGPVIIGLFVLFAAGVIPHVLSRMSVIYRWGLDIAPQTLTVIAVNIAAAAMAFAILFRHYSRTPDPVERRRARLVLAGGTMGMAAGIGVMLGVHLHGRQPGSIFGSTALTAGTLAFLLFPLSFSYAILRYRLFDLSVAIRLGFRYAIARRALLSIVPLLAAAFAFDVWLHGDRPFSDVLSARAGVYTLFAAAAVGAHLTRNRWIDRLDRTFFRERYDARRILIDVVSDLRAAHGFDDVAALATRKIQEALHPKYLIVGVRNSRHAPYETAAAFRPEKAPALPAPSSVLVDLALVLRKPMDVAPESSNWLADRLPEEDLRYLREGRVELLVPIVAADQSTDALLLLGPKRSEEPYSREDRELLAAIADALSLTLRGKLASPPADDLELPRVVAERYRLERLIGRGGMGVVYEAVDLTLDRRVAVKLIRRELVGSESAVRRFEQEARAAAGFSHPNVITVHDFNATPATGAMIVMELLDGHTLRAELVGRPLPSSRVLTVLRAVADAVEAAHARRLLHRDLKPENIFVVSTAAGEHIKVLDFGIAKALDAAEADRGLTTADGAMVGTPRYMAPEQVRGEPPSTSWDVWAMAVVTFEMVTGSHPFAGSRTNADLPPTLKEFFQHALAVDADARPGTARELYVRFEEAVNATPV